MPTTKGFRDFLTEKLGDKVVFDEQNAAGEAATCMQIMNSFISEDVDLIMANATASLQAAQSATGDIPNYGHGGDGLWRGAGSDLHQHRRRG